MGGGWGADTYGFRRCVIDNFSNAYLTTHEIIHTFPDSNGDPVLDGLHTQHKDSIPYTATLHRDGAQQNNDDGDSAGAPGAGRGGRLRVMSVSDANNTSNPINNYNNDSTFTYDYTHDFQGDITVDIPYAGMSNPDSQGNVADGIADFYDETTPGRHWRYEPVSALAQPTVSINGDKLSTSNIAGNYDSLYVANTTDTAYANIYKTKRNVRSYLYLASNQGNDNFVAHGPVGDTFDLSDLGLNINATYVMKVGTFIGNSVSTSSADIFAGDTTAPIAIAKSDTVYLDASGNATANPANFDNGSTDNTGITGRFIDKTNFDCTNIGTNTLQFYVMDAMGNADTTNTIVIVLDTVSPIPHAQNYIVYLDNSGNASITKLDINAYSTDNCGVASDSISRNNFDCTDIGIVNVTYYATDSSGNTDSTIAAITVLDTIHPVVTAQNDTLYLDSTGSYILRVSDINGTSSDNCGIDWDSLSQTGYSCSHLGINSVTYLVADFSGSKDSVIVLVTVLDINSPVAIGRDTTINLNGRSAVNIGAGDIDNGSYDNCRIYTRTLSQNLFTAVGSYPDTLTITDYSGNEDKHVSTINIIDSAFIDIEEIRPLSQVSLYPNPTTGILNIKNEENINIAKITIFDVTGKATAVMNPQGATYIDFSKFKPGLYAIRLEDDQGRVHTKRVVNKR